MVSLALGTSNGVEANNGINDLSPAPEAKKNSSELCYKISVVAALVLGLCKLFLRMKRVSLDKAEQKMLEDQVELLRQENQELKALVYSN